MALSKSKTINRPDGTTATGTYWKITKIVADKQKMTATWTISLFLNQTIADSSGAPLGPTYSFTAPVTKDQIAGDMTALGYTTIVAKIAGPKPSSFNPNGPNPQAWTDLAGATNN